MARKKVYGDGTLGKNISRAILSTITNAENMDRKACVKFSTTVVTEKYDGDKMVYNAEYPVDYERINKQHAPMDIYADIVRMVSGMLSGKILGNVKESELTAYTIETKEVGYGI